MSARRSRTKRRGKDASALDRLALLTGLYGWVGVAMLSAFWGAFAWIGGPDGLEQLVREAKLIPKGGEKEAEAIFKAISEVPPQSLILGIVWSLASSLLFVWSASCIKRRRSRWLIYLCAVVALTNPPIGLALGVYTFVVLGRKGVMSQFH